jgi:hypothetical protein
VLAYGAIYGVPVLYAASAITGVVLHHRCTNPAHAPPPPTIERWKTGDGLLVVAAASGEHNAVETSQDGETVISTADVPGGTKVRVVDVPSSDRTDVVVLAGELAGRRFRILADQYLRR